MGRTINTTELHIQCQRLCKSYKVDGKQFPVIDNVNLEVDRKELLTTLGPGECGKTCLVKIIAGLEKPTEGEVIIDGEPVRGPNPDRGLVFQTIALFPWKTVLQNVEMGPKLKGISKKKRREKARHYIDLVGLEGFEDSYPHELSGGMKQRVGIARVYCNDPSLMLMDEPFGHLDAQTRYMMEEELVRIWQEEKRTIMFVTNNLEEAVYLSDRVAVLEERPTTVKQIYEIDLPRPRDYTDEEFLNTRKEISAAMETRSK